MTAIAFDRTERHAAEPMGYARRAYLADALVHAITVVCAVAAAGTLAVTAFDQGDLNRALALLVYGESLVLTLSLSAAYNLNRNPAMRERLRACDHAGIFAMIAGTYTPLAVLALTPLAGAALLLFMWGAAAAGATIKLRYPRRFERTGIATYLALGWVIFPLLGPLGHAMPPQALWLLGLGGVVYTIGVGFHLARPLPYHTVIWHVFVLIGAACHFAAILRFAASAPR